MDSLFSKNYATICLVKELLGITTKVIWQSEMNYSHEGHKNDLILNLCESVSADVYLSGKGAQKYMNLESFKHAGI